MAQNNIKIKTEVDTGDSVEQVDELSNATENLNDNLKETEKTTKKTGKAVKETKKDFADLPGPIGGVVNALGDVVKGMWALVTNPIGAVLAALAAADSGLDFGAAKGLTCCG